MSWDKLSMVEKANIMRMGVANGVTHLNSIRDIYNSYAIGGDLETPIENPVIPESDDPQAVEWLANWLNNRRAQLNENISSMKDNRMRYITKPDNKRRGDVRKDGYDINYVDVTYNPLLYLKELNPSRIRTNKAFYTEINNAATAPQKILSELPSSSYDTRGVYVAPDYFNNRGHWIGYAGVPDKGTNIHERTHAMNAVPQESKVRSIIGSAKYNDKYLDDEKEIYARLNTMRYLTGLNPNTVVTKKWLDGHRKELKDHNLHRYTDDELLQLFNNVADNTIRIDSIVQDNITAYGGRLNKFDGTSTRSNKMNKTRYVDTQGNVYDGIPEGFVRRSELTERGKQIADDLYRQSHPTELKELTVYPKSGRGARSTGLGSYYDVMNTMTEANKEHVRRVAYSDALVRETAAFERPLNYLSPGQWFGAAVDYFQGESPFWEGIYRGNSGWVTDEFAREHPHWTTIANMAGDTAFGAMGDLTFRNVRTGVQRNMYERGLYDRINNFDAITPDEIHRIAQRRYPYTHEQINPFTSNTAWGRRFRASLGKRIYPDSKMPMMYRKMGVVPDVVDEKIQLTNPNVRWVDVDEQPFTVTNTTTDLPVRPHKSAPRGWQEQSLFVTPFDELLDYDFWSTRPSDTFAVNENIEIPVEKTRVISGDTDYIDAVSERGIDVQTSKALRDTYESSGGEGFLAKPNYKPYASEVQKEAVSSYGRPSVDDYRLMDFVYRPVFRSDVIERTALTDPMEAISRVYGKSPSKLNQYQISAFEDDWLNSNVLYNAATPAEQALRTAMGVRKYGSGGGLSNNPEGMTKVNVASLLPVYRDDETGELYYLSNGTMKNIVDMEEAQALYEAELSNIRQSRIDKKNEVEQALREAQLQDPEYLAAQEAARIREKDRRLSEEAHKRAEESKRNHNRAFLARRSVEDIDRSRKVSDNIERGKRLVQDSLDNAGHQFNNLPDNVAYAVAAQEEDRKGGLHVSLNGINAVVSAAELAVPELALASIVLNGTGIMQDVREGNHWQATAGMAGMSAPLLRAWNPRIRRTRTTYDRLGRRVDTFDDKELGNVLFNTSNGIGILGDIYGFIVDDNMKFIK